MTNSHLLKLNELTNFNLKVGYNTCPFCQGQKKLVIRQTYYKCYLPSCLAHSGGDFIDLLLKAEVTRSRKEGHSLLVNDHQIKQQSYALSRRTKEMEQIFSIYYAAFHKYPQAYSYLENRNLHLTNQPIGYAPNEPDYLSQNGVSQATSERLGLTNRYGRDLLTNRVIFPITDYKGNLLHLQGRSLDPDNDLRWLATKNAESVSPINNLFYNLAGVINEPKVYLTEGITDGLSILSLGLPAISMLGVESSLVPLSYHLPHLSKLTALFDNDKIKQGEKNAGKYKSWARVLPNLIELKLQSPKIQIDCLLPPEKPGIKDFNDWYSNSLTQDEFIKYAHSNTLSLEQFCLKYMAQEEILHPYLWRLFKNTPDYIRQFSQIIQTLYPSYPEYITSVLL